MAQRLLPHPRYLPELRPVTRYRFCAKGKKRGKVMEIRSWFGIFRCSGESGRCSSAPVRMGWIGINLQFPLNAAESYCTGRSSPALVIEYINLAVNVGSSSPSGMLAPRSATDLKNLTAGRWKIESCLDSFIRFRIRLHPMSLLSLDSFSAV